MSTGLKLHQGTTGNPLVSLGAIQWTSYLDHSELSKRIEGADGTMRGAPLYPCASADLLSVHRGEPVVMDNTAVSKKARTYTFSALNGLGAMENSMTGLTVRDKILVLKSKYSLGGVAVTEKMYTDANKRPDYTVRDRGLDTPTNTGKVTLKAGQLLVWAWPLPTELPTPAKHDRGKRPLNKFTLIPMPYDPRTPAENLLSTVRQVLGNAAEYKRAFGAHQTRCRGWMNAAAMFIRHCHTLGLLKILTLIEFGILEPGCLRNAAGEPVAAMGNTPISLERSPVELYEYDLARDPTTAGAYKKIRPSVAGISVGKDGNNAVLNKQKREALTLTVRIGQHLGALQQRGHSMSPSQRVSLWKQANITALARQSQTNSDIASEVGYQYGAQNVARYTQNNGINMGTAEGELLHKQHEASANLCTAIGHAIHEEQRWGGHTKITRTGAPGETFDVSR